MKNQIRLLLVAMLMTGICRAPANAEIPTYAETQQNAHTVKGIVKDALGPMA